MTTKYSAGIIGIEDLDCGEFGGEEGPCTLLRDLSVVPSQGPKLTVAVTLSKQLVFQTLMSSRQSHAFSCLQ